jgi:hypothetical protein
MATFVTAPDPTTIALEPVDNRTVFTVLNDITISMTYYLRSNPTWESTLFTRDQVEEFRRFYVLRGDQATQLVTAARRVRGAAPPPIDPRQMSVTKPKTIANDLGEHQLSLGLNINDNLSLALAAATMLAAGYYTSPVAFLGHLNEAHEDDLAAVYPHVTVLRDNHAVHGDITLLL